MFVSELCYKTLRSCLAVSLIVLTITSTTTAAAIQQSPTVTHTNPGRGPEARQEQAESKQTTTKAPMEWRPIAVSGVDEAQARVYFGAPAEQLLKDQRWRQYRANKERATFGREVERMNQQRIWTLDEQGNVVAAKTRLRAGTGVAIAASSGIRILYALYDKYVGSRAESDAGKEVRFPKAPMTKVPVSSKRK
jgi:hypothetical protein